MVRNNLKNLMKQWATKPRGVTAASRGMTLVEVMVVVIIISLVASMVGVKVFAQLEKARSKTAFTQMKQLASALDLYKLQMKRYPSTAEGLNVLAAPSGNQEPYIDRIPTDPWSNDYVYVYPGTTNSKTFDIMSYGPDGVAGGGDDINVWVDPETTKAP